MSFTFPARGKQRPDSISWTRPFSQTIEHRIAHHASNHCRLAGRSNSYGTRRMGDVPSAKPETCQVWSISLDGVGIRSSRRYRPSPAAAVAPTPSRGSTVVPPRAGSKLLRDDGVSLGEVTVEVSWRLRGLTGRFYLGVSFCRGRRLVGVMYHHLFKAGSQVRCVVSIALPNVYDGDRWSSLLRTRPWLRGARLGSIRTGGIRSRVGRLHAGPKSRSVRKETGTSTKTQLFWFFPQR